MQIFSFELQKWTTAIWNYKTFQHLEMVIWYSKQSLLEWVFNQQKNMFLALSHHKHTSFLVKQTLLLTKHRKPFLALCKSAILT